jgi:hypothetical protein
MGISIQCKGGCVMIQIFLDGFNVITGFEAVYGEGMTKLVEAENRVFLVRAENRMCYNADRLWLCRGLFLHERKNDAWHERAGSTRL